MNSVYFEDQYDHINPMENTHDYTHLIDTKEQNKEDSEDEQEEWFEEKNGNKITEEELESIHPDLNHNFLYPTMNSGIINVNHSDPETLIDDP